MDQLDARNVVMSRLAEMPDAPPIRWPNAASSAGAIPRLEVQSAPSSAVPFLLDGGHRYAGELAVTAVGANERGTAETDAMVKAILAHFAPPLRLDGVVIVDLPDVRPPLVTDTEFRVPIFIRYRALL